MCGLLRLSYIITDRYSEKARCCNSSEAFSERNSHTCIRVSDIRLFARTPVIFDRVVTNVGKAYNSTSGRFTAPINGTYQFNVVISAQGRHRVSVSLTDPRADWAAWLPGTCQVGQLVQRPGGPPRQMLKYRSNDLPRQQGQGSNGGERRERGTKSQTGGEGRREWNRGGNPGLYLDICVGVPEFLVTPLLMGPVCLFSPGRFEEPVRPWTDV